MFLLNTLRELRRGSTTRRRNSDRGLTRSRQPRRLVLEALEDRTLLSYSFTLIADDSGVFTLPTIPTINNAGTVAFQTSLIWGRDAIFTGDGGPHHLIAITGHPADTFPGNPTINSAGTVTFRATFGSGGQAVLTGDGGELTTIADTSDGTFSQFIGAQQINDAGRVGFLAELTAGGRAVLIGNGGPPTTLYDTVTHFHDIVSLGRLNNQGTVGLIAQLTEGIDGIYTGNGGPLATIADTSDAFRDVRPASLNDAGEMAFRATLRDGGQAILKGNGGQLTIVALTGGTYTGFLGAPGIGFNNAEGVAFVATLRAGGTGIFTGTDPVADKVIATGDPLFGSTVTTLGTGTIGNRGLNDAGQIAFRVGLADGRTVLARADPGSQSPGSTLAIGSFLSAVNLSGGDGRAATAWTTDEPHTAMVDTSAFLNLRLGPEPLPAPLAGAAPAQRPVGDRAPGLLSAPGPASISPVGGVDDRVFADFTGDWLNDTLLNGLALAGGSRA
jgi:hypothetical protein